MNTMSKAEGIPFKVCINGHSCIITIYDDRTCIEFTKFQQIIDVRHENIRCIQQWKNNLLLNVQNEREFYTIIIEQKNAGKVRDIVAEKLA